MFEVKLGRQPAGKGRPEAAVPVTSAEELAPDFECEAPCMSLMVQEIHEQPAALERTLRMEHRTIVRIKKIAQRRSFRLFYLIARCTSDNAA